MALSLLRDSRTTAGRENGNLFASYEPRAAFVGLAKLLALYRHTRHLSAAHYSVQGCPWAEKTAARGGIMYWGVVTPPRKRSEHHRLERPEPRVDVVGQSGFEQAREVY